MRFTSRHVGLALALLWGLFVVHPAHAAKSATRAASIKAKWEEPAYRANVYKGRFGGNSPQARRARAQGQWADPVKAAEMIIARHGAAAPSLDKVYEAVKAQFGGNSTEARSLRAKMQWARRPPAVASPVAVREHLGRAVFASEPTPVTAPVAPVAAAAPGPPRGRLAAWALRGRLGAVATHFIMSKPVQRAIEQASELAWNAKYDEALAALPSGPGLTEREQVEIERTRNAIHRTRDVRAGAPLE